jgi:cysteine desulfurase / selenocysteine lyase
MIAVADVKHAPFDVERVREDFPALRQTVHGKPLVYLDNAASSQTPVQVVDALKHAYLHDRANIHRGVHLLSQRATLAYEEVRNKVARFINAAESREVIFVRGTTEAINLVAQSLGRSTLQAGDEILLTWLEHHSNIVPWQMLAEQTGAVVKVAPIADDGSVDLDAFRALLGPRTKIAALSHVSNALGTINPIRDMLQWAREVGAVTVVDGAQAVPHLAVDVQDLDCDFYAFSAHKMYGPTGIGVLYGKAKRLEAMPPWQGGGDMILSVSFGGTSYNEIPYKFEAGTPNIAGVIALGAAIDWLTHIGVENVQAHENALLHAATKALSALPGLRIIGTAAHKAAVVSFVLDGAELDAGPHGIHPHDIGTILDSAGVAIRTGHHCAEPVMQRFGVPATARASFAAYNTFAEVESLAAALRHCIQLLSGNGAVA